MRRATANWLAILILAGLCAAAHPDAEGERLLKGLAAAYKNADSLTYDLKVSQAPRSGEGEPTKVEANVSLKKPNLAKIEITSEEPRLRGVLVCDGSHIWEYAPDKSACLKRVVPDDPGELGGKLAGMYYGPIGAFFSKDPYEVLTRFSTDVSAAGLESLDGVDCSVAVVDYGEQKRRFFIGNDDHMLRKAVVTVGTGDEAKEAVSEFCLNVRLNPPIETTRFSPPELPEGTEITEVPKMKGNLIVAGQKAPDLAGSTLEGKDVRLSDYRGKAVLIDFWASWCGPCKWIIPDLKRLNEEFAPKGLVVIGVNIWDEGDKLKAAIEDFGIDYTVLFAPRDKTKVDLQYVVEAIPTLYLIDKEGVIRGGWMGADPAHADAIREALVELGMK